jgi:hypothetical protein
VYTTFSLTGGDTISVRLTSSDPCATSTTAFSNKIVVELSTAVVNVSSEGVSVRLYPNPNRGMFTVAVAGGRAGLRTVLEVVNALGQRVYLREIITDRKDWSAPVELHDVAAGVYLLRISSEDAGSTSTRFKVE